MPALKTSYMKTAKASWLRAVRQSHAARGYGRDSHFWADRAVFPPNRPANEKDALRLDRAWGEGQKREFELAKPRTDTSHSKRLGAPVLSSFVFLDRTGLGRFSLISRARTLVAVSLRRVATAHDRGPKPAPATRGCTSSKLLRPRNQGLTLRLNSGPKTAKLRRYARRCCLPRLT